MEEFWVNKIKIPKVALRKGESVSFGGGEMVFDLNQHTKEEFKEIVKQLKEDLLWQNQNSK